MILAPIQVRSIVMPLVTTQYERTKLYEEVWAEPVTAVSKRYGISDVAPRKIFQALSGPLPPRGDRARGGGGKAPPGAPSSPPTAQGARPHPHATTAPTAP